MRSFQLQANHKYSATLVVAVPQRLVSHMLISRAAQTQSVTIMFSAPSMFVLEALVLIHSALIMDVEVIH